MNWSQSGDFTKSLVSIQLQLKTLLEDVGGDSAAELMDSVAKLNGSERQAILPVITAVINKVLKSPNRAASNEDIELKEFEDSLFESVAAALAEQNGNAPQEDPKRLAVLKGGKTAHTVALRSSGTKDRPVKISTLIDLAKARDAKKRSDSSFRR